MTPARRDEWLRALYAIALRVREMQAEWDRLAQAVEDLAGYDGEL